MKKRVDELIDVLQQDQKNVLQQEQKNNIINIEFLVEEIPALPKSNIAKGYVIILGPKDQDLGLKANDIIEIIGERKTYGRLLYDPKDIYQYGRDSTTPLIQMDFNTRKNAEVKIGDSIKIRKIECLPATRVVLVSDNPDAKNYLADFKSFKNMLVGKVIAKGDEIWYPAFNYPPNPGIRKGVVPLKPSDIYFTVFFYEPKGRKTPAVVIDENTVIKIRKNPMGNYDSIFSEEIYLDDVGGLTKAKESLMELIGVLVNQSEFVDYTGIKFTNSVLLSGPSGCGKTLLAKAIVNEFPLSYFYINGPEIAGEKPTTAPDDIKKIFSTAEEVGPSIILIDEIEALATNREDLRFDAIMRNIVTQFLHSLENISGRHQVFVIGTTNKEKSIDPAFLTANRFGKVIKILPPKEDERFEILQIMARNLDIIDTKNFDEKIIAENTYGFNGGDLNLLFQTAFIEKLKKLGIYERFLKYKLSYRILKSKVSLITEDIMHVLKEKIITPSILRSYAIETPKIKFSDVGGLDNVKRLLEENIKLPLLYPEIYKHYGVGNFKGLLLHGPPGCGKTLVVKALASEADMNFISIKGAEVLNHWLGESEAAVREIFAKAKESAPCIVFFDELDAISTIRGVEGNVHSDRVTAQLLTELDGIEDRKDVICIGATNRIDIIDPAIMRPGRLYPVIEIGLPNADERKEILKIYLRNKPVSIDVNIDKFIEEIDGFNGAMIEELCNQAALIAIRRYLKNVQGEPETNLPPITMNDFHEALDVVKEKIKEEKKLHLYV